MALRVRIQSIRKTNRPNAHERIRFVGGLNDDGTRWKLAEPDAIDGIKRGDWDFYVRVGVAAVDVVVAVSPEGHEYLKTKADAIVPDRLLSLPECP
ncbi:MAG: DUF3892 domain-containing protein [Hyphomicrobiales bacterium]|nr:DUF3892 domain-containing protein [Hyphomicrobiales bacterium]